MSFIRYSSLLHTIGTNIKDLNHVKQILDVGKSLTEGSKTCEIVNIQVKAEDDIPLLLKKLFSDLEQHDHLGIDNVGGLREILNRAGERSLCNEVDIFERLRKKIKTLIEEVITRLNKRDCLERLKLLCADQLSEDARNDIPDVGTLFKKLQKENRMGIEQTDGILRKILEVTEQKDLLEKLEDFQKECKQEDEKWDPKAPFVFLYNKVKDVGQQIGDLVLRCDFTTPKGIAVGVGIGLILHQYFPNSIPWLVEGFRALLPAAVALRGLFRGSVCFLVQAENRQALQALWDQYQDGTLQRNLQRFLVTNEIRLEFGEEVILSVDIDEQNFKDACLSFIVAENQVLQKDEQEVPVVRTRRNSDSIVYVKSKENDEKIMVHSQLRQQADIQLHQEKIQSLEKENENLRAKIPAGTADPPPDSELSKWTPSSVKTEESSAPTQIIADPPVSELPKWTPSSVKIIADPSAISPRLAAKRKIARESSFAAMKILKTVPPEVNVTLPKIEDLPKKSVPFDDMQIPIDFLVLTVEECALLCCLAYLNPGFSKSYRKEFGYVYFGDRGKARVAVMMYNMASYDSGDVHNAIRVLEPSAVFFLGVCEVNTDKIKLGDVVVSKKVIAKVPSKVTQDGTEEWGFKGPSKYLAQLVRIVDDGWKAPLKDPEELEVKIHRGAFLSCPEVADSNEQKYKLIKQFPDAIAIEMEGQGTFATTLKPDVDWIIIKGVPDYADGNKSNTNSWRPFASLMAASLIADVLSHPTFFNFYGRGNTTTPSFSGEHRRVEQPARASPSISSIPDPVTRGRAVIKDGVLEDDELEELSMELANSWDDLARRLKFNFPEIAAFHRENKEYAKKASRMLFQWKQKNGSQATYSVLYNALGHEFLNRKDLAEKFCCK